MSDATEPYRRQRIIEINAQPGSREALEAQHGQVWTTEELSQEFGVIGFMAPFVVVRRKSDGKKGKFQHSPGFTLASRHTTADARISFLEASKQLCFCG